MKIKIFNSIQAVPIVVFLCLPSMRGLGSGSSLNTFHRCYSHITGNYALSSQLFPQVVSGELDPIVACQKVLAKALLVGNPSELSDKKDQEAISVLNQFHTLHMSWLRYKDFSEIAKRPDDFTTRELFDPSEPALYFTKALFDEQTPIDYVLTAKTHLRAKREIKSPTMTQGKFGGTQVHKNDFYFGSQVSLPDRGLLLGIAEQEQQNWNLESENLKIFQHFGGGLLGNTTYFLEVFQKVLGFQSDGGLHMARTWSEAVIEDVLCRQLPVLKSEDVEDMIQEDSIYTFRRSASCLKCHETIDPMAGAVRHVKIVEFGEGRDLGGVFFQKFNTNMPKVLNLPDKALSNYFNTPPTSQLTFRNFENKITSIQAANLQSLGEKISKTDDFYQCIAQRYIEYFYGFHKWPVIGQKIIAGSLVEKYFKKKNKFGKELKYHNDSFALINSILNDEDYKNPIGELEGIGR